MDVENCGLVPRPPFSTPLNSALCRSLRSRHNRRESPHNKRIHLTNPGLLPGLACDSRRFAEKQNRFAEMKLPNAERAFIDIKKLENYCLNPLHPRGKHKAKVFASALGLTKENSMELKEEIVKSISEEQCEISETDQYGQRYVVDFDY